MHPFIAEQLVADRHVRLLADADHNQRVRAVGAGRPGAAPTAIWPRWFRRLGIGALGVVGALVAFAGPPAESRPNSPPSPSGAEVATLVGFTPHASERVAYAPGASRAWAPGQTVTVRVLSGCLSVYDDSSGQRRIYAAGEGYAAGWAPYRAVNETDQEVETLVTTHAQAT